MSKPDDKGQDGGPVRLDKWLWAARFFKTRALAQHAIELGRIYVEGVPAKASRAVVAGQRLRINSDRGCFEVTVVEVAAKRRSGTLAKLMYEESAEGRIRREHEAELRRQARSIAPQERPNTQQRRLLRRIKEGD